MTPRNRILLVDDEPLLLMEIEDALADFGWRVVGTASRLASGLELAQQLDYDFALLDVNLGGERVDTVAAAALARGAKIIYLTGYAADGAPTPDAMVLEKPFPIERLHAALLSLSDVHA